jgi:hypothetical protein
MIRVVIRLQTRCVMTLWMLRIIPVISAVVNLVIQTQELVFLVTQHIQTKNTFTIQKSQTVRSGTGFIPSLQESEKMLRQKKLVVGMVCVVFIRIMDILMESAARMLILKTRRSRFIVIMVSAVAAVAGIQLKNVLKVVSLG